jgi:hypothetical protein
MKEVLMKLNKIAMALSATVYGVLLGNMSLCFAEAHDNKNVKDGEVLAVDSKLNFHYMAQYRNEADKRKDADAKTLAHTEKNDFSHGAGFNFDTGYLNDILGAEFGATFVNPLYVKKDTSAVHAPNSKATLAENDGGETFAKIQQAYLKSHYVYNDIELKAGYGVTQRNLLTFKDCTSKIASGNSYGYDISATGEGLTAYFTSILGGSKNNNTKFVTSLQQDAVTKAKSIDPKHTGGIDSGLYITGLNYEFEGLTLGLEYGMGRVKFKEITASTDVKVNDDRYLVKLGYKFDLDEGVALALDARYGHNKLSLDNMPTIADQKSSFYNFNATVSYESAFVTVGYSKIRDGKYEDKYFRGMFPSLGSSASFDCSLNLEEEYNLENEQAFLVKVGYDLTAVGVDGLKAETWFAKGSDAKLNGVELKDFSRKEFGVKLCYDFQEDLKGLKLAYKFAHYDASADIAGSSTPDLPAATIENTLGSDLNKYNEHRVTVSYAYDMWK